MASDKYTQAALIIIKEQELIAGPLAFDLARMATNIKVENSENIALAGDPKTALENLVMQYQKLFGNASVEVSKQAINKASLGFNPDELPAILK